MQTSMAEAGFQALPDFGPVVDVAPAPDPPPVSDTDVTLSIHHRSASSGAIASQSRNLKRGVAVRFGTSCQCCGLVVVSRTLASDVPAVAQRVRELVPTFARPVGQYSESFWVVLMPPNDPLGRPTERCKSGLYVCSVCFMAGFVYIVKGPTSDTNTTSVLFKHAKRYHEVDDIDSEPSLAASAVAEKQGA